MGGHHVGHIRPGLSQGLHLHAGGVHRNGTQLLSQLFKEPVGMTVSGTLHGNPPLSQHCRQQHHQIVIPGSQNHLFRAAVDAPGLVKIVQMVSRSSHSPLGSPSWNNSFLSSSSTFRVTFRQTL